MRLHFVTIPMAEKILEQARMYGRIVVSTCRDLGNGVDVDVHGHSGPGVYTWPADDRSILGSEFIGYSDPDSPMPSPQKGYEAVVEYSDGSEIENLRGYVSSGYDGGAAQFRFADDEVISIPLHRVKTIHERPIVDPV